MGWLFALGFAVLTFLGLHLSKMCSRVALEIAGAAILAGVAGYAWQGSPGMPGHPVAQASKAEK